MAITGDRDPRDEFAAALKAAGLVVEDGPVMDGRFHRVPVEGARRGTRDGSYIGHLDGKPSGYIENFKTGHKETWTASGVQLSGRERADAAALMHIARQERAATLAAQQQQTASGVQLRWDGLTDSPSTGQNAYLARKGVNGYGVKFDGDRLVVPVRDVDGKLWSVQSISPSEGTPKIFEKGGRKSGNMHLIGEIEPGAEILVAEGYATGASLHQATGKAVAVAFDAGNLDAVVGAIKERYPTSPVLITGDDDRSQQPNVGFEKATAAGRNHGAMVTFPVFQEPGKHSDFNDLHVLEGLAVVKAQVELALRLAVDSRQGPWPKAPESRVEVSTPSPQLDAAAKSSASIEKTEETAVTVQSTSLATAKLPSVVAPGNVVEALDVASAAAGITPTPSAEGLAVELGAQVVAGNSAQEATERSLNTAKASPHAAPAADAKTPLRQRGLDAQTSPGESEVPRETRGVVRAVRSQVDQEANVRRSQSKITPLEDRFNIVRRIGRGRDYHFRDHPGKVAFQERWLSLTSTAATPAVVKAMIDRAQERGWETIRIEGSEEFMRQAWIAASVRGIKAIGYEPTQGDRAAEAEERARLGLGPARTGGPLERAVVQERVDPHIETQKSAQRHSGAPRATASEKAAHRPLVTPLTAEPVELATQAPPRTVERPISSPLRAALMARGIAPAEVEAVVALAAERMPRDRVYVGQLVAHGADRFDFDSKNENNYYVKLQGPSGEKIVWGVDLRRALEVDALKVGDTIALEHRGTQPVTLRIKERDSAGKVVRQHDELVRKNTWYAVDVEQLRRQASVRVRLEDPAAESERDVAATPERAPAGFSMQAPGLARQRSPAVDDTASRIGHLNKREAMIGRVLEAVLDQQQVSQEERQAVRDAVRKELDVRMALGKPAQVAIYDPAAPAREPQRKVELSVHRQQKEQERRR